MIKTVIDMRGVKRFKKKAGEDEFSAGAADLPLDISNISNVKDIFRKMQNTTSYAMNFGDRPKAA